MKSYMRNLYFENLHCKHITMSFMSPLCIEFVEKIFIVGSVTGIIHVCYFLYVSKCLIPFAWQHNSTTVCKLIFYKKILLIKMYRTHSHISFLINFYRPN